jgi:hypothetical protein
MGAPAHPLVATSLVALRRLAATHAPAAADELAAELEIAWSRQPFAVGLAGEVGARTELVNFLCGRKVLDPQGRNASSAALRIARGQISRFRAVRDDGTTEEHSLPADVDGEDAEARKLRVDGARAVLAERDLALDRVARALPRALRGRPRWWEFWLWPIRWILGRRHKRALMEQNLAGQAAAEAQRALEAAEADQNASEDVVRVKRARYFESLRQVSTNSNVREVALELQGGPLREGIELVEMSAATRTAALIDAVLVVESNTVYLTDMELRTPAKVGAMADAIAALPQLLIAARARKVGTRARDTIAAVVTGAQEILDREQAGWGARIQRLEDMRLEDPAGFQHAELARLQPMMMTSVHAVIEHASGHLGAEMARLADSWIGAIASAGTKDELKAIVEKLQATSPQVTQRIAEEVRLLVVGGAGGVAHDLWPELTAGLRERGLEESRPRSAPELPTIDVLGAFAKSSASKLGGALQWLTGLFRSFDAKRADIREKAHARIEHLREVAYAELLETEPRIHAALGEVLAKQLAAATQRQIEWHASAVAAEHELIVKERDALAPLAKMRDLASKDLDKVTKELAALEGKA